MHLICCQKAAFIFFLLLNERHLRFFFHNVHHQYFLNWIEWKVPITCATNQKYECMTFLQYKSIHSININIYKFYHHFSASLTQSDFSIFILAIALSCASIWCSHNFFFFKFNNFYKSFSKDLYEQFVTSP